MGPNYYAPVLLNVFITSITITCLALVIRPLGASSRYITCFVIFASLHWSTLAWSSFLNLKGPTVACLVAIELLAITSLPRKAISSGIALLVSFYLLTKIRFYFPTFLIGGLAIEKISGFLNVYSQKKKLLLFALILGLAASYIFKTQI